VLLRVSDQGLRARSMCAFGCSTARSAFRSGVAVAHGSSSLAEGLFGSRCGIRRDQGKSSGQRESHAYSKMVHDEATMKRSIAVDVCSALTKARDRLPVHQDCAHGPI